MGGGTLRRNLDFIKQMLQIIMLYSCGQVALYCLSLAYGINASGAGWGWHIFALAPPMITLFILLPILCQSISLFEAFAVPNAPILDNVLSDAESRQADQDYLMSQLDHRVQKSLESNPHQKLANMGERLAVFEETFEREHTALVRWWRAFYDLARGQALCFIDKEACFLVGVLEICNVPVSRERLERLVPWYKSELAAAATEHGALLHVADIFQILDVDPPSHSVACQARMRLRNTSREGTKEVTVV